MTDKRVDVTELDDTIASRLKRVRTALGLKSAEMAEYIGVGGSKYSNLETGKTKADHDLLDQIDAVLAANGVPAGWVKGNAMATVGQPDAPAPIDYSEFVDRLEGVVKDVFTIANDLRAAITPEPSGLARQILDQADVLEDAEGFAKVTDEELAPTPGLEFLAPPSYPVAPPAVDVPLPIELGTPMPVIPFPFPGTPAPVIVIPAVTQPAPLYTQPLGPGVPTVGVDPAAFDLAAFLGAPSAPAPDSAMFAQPAPAVLDDERSMLEILIEQHGPHGAPGVPSFIPAAPASV